MHFFKLTGRFLLGGTAYTALELLWRGHSHISMFAAGGVCFLLLGALERAKRLPHTLKPLLGAGMITAVELGFGLLVNRGYTVWDYRQMPLNFKGQVCLPYSLLWVPVSALGLLLCSMLDGKKSKGA